MVYVQAPLQGKHKPNEPTLVIIEPRLACRFNRNQRAHLSMQMLTYSKRTSGYVRTGWIFATYLSLTDAVSRAR